MANNTVYPTNGTDLTAVQTRKATPETPKYTSAVDIFKQYATKPDDGPEQQALDYAQTHRGLYAVTDFVASLANVISAAHGATPQQMTSLSAANGQRIQQLRQIQEARRQRYEQGLMSAALSDAQYNNQREERLRQEAREDAYRKQQQDNTDRAFRAQQEQVRQQQELSRDKMAEDKRQFGETLRLNREKASQEAQDRRDYNTARLAVQQAEAEARTYKPENYTTHNGIEYSRAKVNNIKPTVMDMFAKSGMLPTDLDKINKDLLAAGMGVPGDKAEDIIIKAAQAYPNILKYITEQAARTTSLQTWDYGDAAKPDWNYNN